MENPIEIKHQVNERERERENKESAPDFLKIFNDRLQGIKPETGEDAKGLASWYDDPEISEIAKEAPVVFFDLDNLVDFAPPTDIWIEDPNNLYGSTDYIHDQVKSGLGKFIGKSNMPYLLAGYILENGNGTRFIILDETRADGVKNRIKKSEGSSEQENLTLLDVLNRYNISKVIEKTSKKVVDGDTTTWKGSSREVVGKSMLDKRREDMALINLARKHRMTNSQYLRLIILAERLLEANAQVSLEKIAEDIVKNPDSENIPISNV